MTPNSVGKEPSMVSILPPAEWTWVLLSVKSKREMGTRKELGAKRVEEGSRKHSSDGNIQDWFPEKVEARNWLLSLCLHICFSPAFWCWEEVMGTTGSRGRWFLLRRIRNWTRSSGGICCRNWRVLFGLSPCHGVGAPLERFGHWELLIPRVCVPKWNHRAHRRNTEVRNAFTVKSLETKLWSNRLPCLLSKGELKLAEIELVTDSLCFSSLAEFQVFLEHSEQHLNQRTQRKSGGNLTCKCFFH